jgi:hypothetical protein
MASKIKRSYLNYRLAGSLSGLSGFKQSGNRKESRQSLENVLKTIPAYALHFSRRKRFPRRTVYVPYINAQWGMDLMDISKYSKYNNGHTFLLTAIDIFSKRAYVEPIKNKSGSCVAEALRRIFKRSYGIPEKVQCDLGLEFYNRDVKKVLDEHRIHLFSTQSELKSCVIERFNRTLLEKLHRYMTHFKTKKFVHKIRDFENHYNRHYHRSIKCRPIDVVPANQATVHNNLYGHLTNAVDTSEEKFKIGDTVLISKVKKVFEKGSSANYQSERFIIRKIKHNTVPRTYVLQDMSGQELEGGFYRQELQKVYY